jgi:maleylpyruvate isomerase
VVSHLARNADALTHVLHGAAAGELHPMYPSNEQRDAEIEEGVARSPDELREDVIASADRWQQAANGLPVSRLGAPGCRLPSGPTWPVSRTGLMRWTEVEVHHADLGVGYTADDWPPEFVASLLDRRQRELSETGPAFGWESHETEDRWSSGDGPLVAGRAPDLAWWLIGRGAGEGLTCSEGALPELGRWA